MVWLVLGLVLFLGVHSIAIVSPGGRNRLAAQLGENAFKGLYSLASFVGLVLIVWGYGLARETPVLLYALLFGLAFHFLWDDARLRPGIDFCARTLLRAGVALLGLRIGFDQVLALGWRTGLIALSAVALTIALGLALARWLGRPREEGWIAGCSVGICGASAALAVSSALPPTRENERFTLLAVVGVTLMSTLAMLLYPLLARTVGFSPHQAGVFFGATIHDVAQVVAAGMLLSDAGNTAAADSATVVKLFRVMLLMPVVMVSPTS